MNDLNELIEFWEKYKTWVESRTDDFDYVSHLPPRSKTIDAINTTIKSLRHLQHIDPSFKVETTGK